jgi:hypothetical protein
MYKLISTNIIWCTLNQFLTIETTITVHPHTKQRLTIAVYLRTCVSIEYKYFQRIFSLQATFSLEEMLDVASLHNAT